MPSGKSVYTTQRPKTFDNPGEETAPKARSHPTGTFFSALESDGCDRMPFPTIGATARSLLRVRLTICLSGPFVLGNDGNETKISESSEITRAVRCTKDCLRISPSEHSQRGNLSRLLCVPARGEKGPWTLSAIYRSGLIT